MNAERAKYDEVADSIRNGQRKQARDQMEFVDDLAAMLDYFNHNLNDPGLAIDAAKTYFRGL